MELKEAFKINLERNGLLDDVRNDLRRKVSHILQQCKPVIERKTRTKVSDGLNCNSAKKGAKRNVPVYSRIQDEVKAILERNGQIDCIRCDLRSKMVSSFLADECE